MGNGLNFLASVTPGCDSITIAIYSVDGAFIIIRDIGVQEPTLRHNLTRANEIHIRLTNLYQDFGYKLTVRFYTNLTSSEERTDAINMFYTFKKRKTFLHSIPQYLNTKVFSLENRILQLMGFLYGMPKDF